MGRVSVEKILTRIDDDDTNKTRHPLLIPMLLMKESKQINSVFKKLLFPENSSRLYAYNSYTLCCIYYIYMYIFIIYSIRKTLKL